MEYLVRETKVSLIFVKTSNCNLSISLILRCRGVEGAAPYSGCYLPDKLKLD